MKLLLRVSFSLFFSLRNKIKRRRNSLFSAIESIEEDRGIIDVMDQCITGGTLVSKKLSPESNNSSL